jgi:geranylgeranyl diphosphate synthase type I
MTTEDKELAHRKVNTLLRERCKEILEKFGQVAVSGVREPKLLAALEDVKKYWRDLNRPSLTFFSCEAVGGSYEISKDAALMFTLASSGFGIHDDILDRSMNKHLRRMTILGLHGLETALLVGDLLIVKAWTVAHEMIRKSRNPSKIADVLAAYGSLSVQVCEAELMETQCRGKVDTELDFYENVLWKETAETDACCRIGAMMGDGQPNEVEALSEFGRGIGFLSRLADEVDDCLNLKGDLPHRIKYESVPLPLLYAAKFSIKEYTRIKQIVEKKNIDTTDVMILLTSLDETEALSYILNLAEKTEAVAKSNIRNLKESKARYALLALLNSAYTRLIRLCT